MKRQLIVAVREPEYIRRLSDYLRDSPFGRQWQLTAFTGDDTLRTFLQGGYPIDLLVVQPSFLREEEPSPNLPAAALVKRKGECPRLREIEQYQPLPQLMQAISSAYAAIWGADLPAGTAGGAAVIGICSASGGAGKTVLALHAARQAAATGKRVFYLNLELWNASGEWIGRRRSSAAPRPEDGEDAFSRLLYTIKSSPASAAARLAEARERDTRLLIDYLPPCPYPEERLSMTADDAVKLIDCVSASKEYDLVVTDFDSGLDELNRAVLERCDRIWWLVPDQAAARRKFALASQYWKRRWPDSFGRSERKIVCVGIGTSDGPDKRPGIDGWRAGSCGWLPEIPLWRAGSGPDGFGGIGSLPPAPAYQAAVVRLLEMSGLRGEGGSGYAAEADRGGTARDGQIADRPERYGIG